MRSTVRNTVLTIASLPYRVYLVYLFKLFLKLGTALLIGPAENCPIFSPVRLLIQKLFWASDESSCVATLTRHLHDNQIWKVTR